MLVGATTFSLVFRLFGTDRWLNSLLLASSLPLLATAALILLGVGLCAWVLDAFEMTFVVVSRVAPVLMARAGSGQQLANRPLLRESFLQNHVHSTQRGFYTCRIAIVKNGNILCESSNQTNLLNR